MKIIQLLILIISLHSYAQQSTCDSVVVSEQTNEKSFVECYYRDTKTIQSRNSSRTDYTKRWHHIKKKTTWYKNGKIKSKMKSKEITGGDWGAVQKSITWYFVIDGKRCLKRKKFIRRIRLH